MNAASRRALTSSTGGGAPPGVPSAAAALGRRPCRKLTLSRFGCCNAPGCSAGNLIALSYGRHVRFSWIRSVSAEVVGRKAAAYWTLPANNDREDIYET